MQKKIGATINESMIQVRVQVARVVRIRGFNPFQSMRLCLFLVRLNAGFGIFTSLKPSFQQVRIKPNLLRGPYFGA